MNMQGLRVRDSRSNHGKGIDTGLNRRVVASGRIRVQCGWDNGHWRRYRFATDIGLVEELGETEDIRLEPG